MTVFGRILIGTLIVVEVIWMLAAGLFNTVQRGVILVFQDVKQ